MEHIKIHIKFVRKMVMWLALKGFLALVVGVLIFVYPNLLSILVGLLLMIYGVIAIILAIKLNKFSNIEIDV